MPSIRFTPHQDPRSSRPSLSFSAISRTLPSGSSVIRVGRYSEKDSNPTVNPNSPSAAPIGFKSKVVSRRHCEFWCANGQWYIKDVKSSSGTFLNHIRLSTAGVESRPWPVNDGDVVQLGIDFKGGEEMIFRCVKIRVECNRGWQKALNSFNTTTHKRLRNLGVQKPKADGDAASTHTSECSICLQSVAPCQSLFVAPCSHVWHYKCIRPILIGNMYPQFLCPNCRAVADLEAEVDEPSEDWEDGEDEIEEARKSMDETEESTADLNQQSQASLASPDAAESSDLSNDLTHDDELARMIDRAFVTNDTELQQQSSGAQPLAEERPSDSTSLQSPSRRDNLGPAVPLNITVRSASDRSIPAATAFRKDSGDDDERDPSSSQAATPSTSSARLITGPGPLVPVIDANSPEGPMTPRNDAGPFVFDGSAGTGSTSSQQTTPVRPLASDGTAS